MGNNIKLSVIVPIYGVEKYIEKCIRSLFEQTFQNGIEFIFVNDCTKDNSIEILLSILEQYPTRKPQTKIINHEQNRGSAAARQTGVNVAQGEYIIHCDSDDWVDVAMYEKMFQKAVADDADMAVVGFVYEYNNRGIVSDEHIPNNNPREYLNLLLTGERFCSVWNKMVKKSLYINNKIQFTEGINMWEDVSVTIPLTFYAKKISYVTDTYYHYNQTNTTSLVTQMSKASLNNLISVVDMLNSFLQKNNALGQYSQSFMNVKITAKLNLLVNTRGEEQKKYSTIYRETDKVILYSKTISPFWRIALLGNSIFGIGVFNIFLWASKWIKRVVNYA